MDDNHIRNTLRYIREHRIKFETKDEKTFWINTFREEHKKRKLTELKLREGFGCDATEIDIY